MKIIMEDMSDELDLKIDPNDWPELEFENEEPFYISCMVDTDDVKVISDAKKVIEYINERLKCD